LYEKAAEPLEHAGRGQSEVSSTEGEERIMATTTNVPVEVYLCSSYEPDAEYVDGRIEERPMGEFDHALWQQAVLKWFWLREKEWNIRAMQELRVQVAATRYRVPDVTLLDRNQPTEQIITHPPLAVFEVLSPEDSLQRLKRRLEDYRNMGIPEIWVIDPQDSSFYRYEERQLTRKGTFSHAEQGITFEMNEIKQFLD
jgi:Uma2 family endonuclease